MRHRVASKQLGRDTKHRKALLRNLMRQLVMHGSLQTTEVKAKQVKRLADKLVVKAKVDTLSSRRQLHRFFGKRDVVNCLVEQVAPVFKDRSSGFTTLERVGKRAGDNAQMARVVWVVEPKATGSLKNPQPAKRPTAAAKKTTATAKKPVKKPTKSTASTTKTTKTSRSTKKVSK